MKRFAMLSMAAVAAALVITFPAMAEDAVNASTSMGKGLAVMGAGLALIGGGIGIGLIGGNATQAIARQPEAGGQIFQTMIISAALIEGATLFAVVVALIS